MPTGCGTGAGYPPRPAWLAQMEYWAGSAPTWKEADMPARRENGRPFKKEPNGPKKGRKV